MNENELYHYGIKGMKWGVRRTPEQLGRKSNSIKLNKNGIKKKVSTVGFNERKTYFDSLEFRNKTTDKALNDRIDKLGRWSNSKEFENTKETAKEICRDVIMTRRPSERDKFLSRLSSTLDSAVYDDPSVMSVNKRTGYMRYNSCVKFDINGVNMDSNTGKYKTNELDKILNHEPGSTYYYVWGELQNN